MAKMFYTLDEAAEKLGKSTDDVKQLAEDGKLQQFRDRDKLMFKVDQVDALAAPPKKQASADSSIGLVASSDDTDTISLLDSGEGTSLGDAVNIGEDDTGTFKPESPKSGTASGISVFDAEEVESADPMAATQITGGFSGDDEELTLDSVGSGSGLLDLTRESDDTSLGAVELLEDIGGGEGGDQTVAETGTGLPGGGSSGIFEAAGGVDSAPSSIGALEEVGAEPEMVGAAYQVVEDDPTGDGFGGGMLLGVFIVLVLATVVVFSGVNGVVAQITSVLSSGNADMTKGLMYYAGMGVICLVLGGIGWGIGRARA